MSNDKVSSVLIVAAIAALIGVSFVGLRLFARDESPQTGQAIAIPNAQRADGQGCRLALLDGTLVGHPQWGVAVGGENEPPQLVFWPSGWSAWLTDDGTALLDRQGRAVAHTGDRVRAAGGLAVFGGREGFAVCATDLHFEAAAP